jgi:hypothetical protein
MPCIPAFQTLYRFTWSDTGVIQFTNGPIFVIDAPPAAGSPAALRQLNFGVEQIFTRGVNGIIQMASSEFIHPPFATSQLTLPKTQAFASTPVLAP